MKGKHNAALPSGGEKLNIQYKYIKKIKNNWISGFLTHRFYPERPSCGEGRCLRGLCG